MIGAAGTTIAPEGPVRAALWECAEAEAATGGHSTMPWAVTGVSLDSRTLAEGDLFVAVQGETHDGHDYLKAAFAAGAAAAMVSRIPADHGDGKPLLIVDDTYCGLRALARASRKRTPARVLAVTGSVGKTSTKEALAHALAPFGPVAATLGNLNNRWGVPLSLARMPEKSAFGVFEIGMNHAGEITPLSRLVAPQIAIITAIEAVHLEHFDSIEGIARAKAEIFDGLASDGAVVLNRDNPWFDFLAARARERSIGTIIGFGASEGAEARLLAYEPGPKPASARIEAEILGRSLKITLALPGRHSALNAMAVLAAAGLAGVDVKIAAEALASLQAPAGRGRLLRATLAEGGTIQVIDDAYNAAPASMAAAFRVLAAHRPEGRGRRVAVLGDMLELGPGSARAHAALAEDLLAAGVELVFTTGHNMIHLDDALPRHMRGGHADSVDDLVAMLPRQLKSGDVVLIKASHAQNLGRLVASLTNPATPNADPGRRNGR